MVPHITEIVNEVFDNIQNLDDVEILEEMQKITGEVICRMFFGKSFSKIEIEGLPITLAIAETLQDIIK